MDAEEDISQLSYDDRFYPTRRAALSYSAILLLLSWAIPNIDENTNEITPTKVTLSIADVSFDTRLLIGMLIAAVIFYTIGFWRAHSNTSLLNSQAISKSATEVSSALSNTAIEIGKASDQLALSNRLYSELTGMLSHPDLRPINMNLIIPNITERIRELGMESSRLSTIRSASPQIDISAREEELQRSYMEIINEIYRDGDNNLRNILSSRIAIEKKASHKFDEMAFEASSSLNKISKLSADFSRLSRNFRGSAARWYLLYDIAPVYVTAAASICFGVLAIFEIRYENFTPEGIIISAALIALLLIPTALRWWSHIIPKDDLPLN